MRAVRSEEEVDDQHPKKQSGGSKRSNDEGAPVELRRHGSILLAMSWKMTGSGYQRLPVPRAFRFKCNAN
jgi:hypothetical protein